MDRFLKIQKHMTLLHEADIKTSSQKIWEFLINIEKNYSAWHPIDHILFQWTKGEPFETGSTFYAEQYRIGEKVKYNETSHELALKQGNHYNDEFHLMPLK